RVQTHLQSVARACQGEPDNGLRPPAVPRPAFDLMLGNSQAMRRIYQLIARVAPTDATVLIVGESGTGKELIAQTIHARSRRHRGPLVPINCGAIPENLIESELFGHEKGAFTGASQMRRGVFERAHGGTLFLDEISEMPADLQVRLLRALETNKITRVGGEKEIPIDTRIIAATNRPPEQAVAQGKLREDLLYRLAVFPIHVPPLRHRDDDVELLAHHFLAVFNKSQGRAKRFHPLALQRLRAHPWPGNVRQLRNAIHRAYILADAEIGPDDLPPPTTAANKPIHGELRFPLGSPLADIERQMILATLEHFKGDKRRTAKTLGVSLKTLYNRLNAYRVNNGSSAAQRVGASRAGLM
ncbi:MAG TPA: sigma-54 dependent transcriptional regulator, partial [Phycisphaeraceae bacterium]